MSSSTRCTTLPSELASQAVEILREDSREARLAAAQLLARGWAMDEEARLAALPLVDRPPDDEEE